MWTQPRATIAQIVDRDPTRLVLGLAMVSGILEALGRASMKSAGDKLEMPYLLPAVVVGGILGGIIGLYIGAILLRLTGGWIGGVATSEKLRAALAWSSVPAIWAGLLWIPEGILFGKELFTSETPVIDASPFLSKALLGFGALEMVIGVWALVVMLKAIGQVQGFSAWEALGNVFLSGAVIVVPLILIFVGFTFLT